MATQSVYVKRVGAAQAAAHAEPLSGRRRALVWTLVVAASVIAFVSILTTWVNRQLLDNSSWNKASTQVIQDQAVQSALSVYMVNQVYDNIDVAQALGQRLPPNLQGLAAPLAGALQQPATQTVQAQLDRPRFQQAFIGASMIAHEKLVNVLENKTGHGLSTTDGVVTLDLSQLITQVATRLGLPQAAIAKIPPGAGDITIMTSSQLSTAQTAVRALKVLSTWLLVLVLGLFALAIYLARGIRRETLRNVGWALVIVGLLVLIVRRVGGNYAVNGLTEAQYREPARHVFLIASSILGQIGWAALSYGLLGALGAVLAGPTRWATTVRRRLAPVLNEQQGLAWLGVGLVYLLLVYWGPTQMLRTVWGVLLLGALLAYGVWALRRETLREFPATDVARAHPGRLTTERRHNRRRRMK